MSDQPKRILVLFGTRPEAIKLFPVIRALAVDQRFDVRVGVSAQHRAMLDSVLAMAGIVADHDLDLMRPDQSLDSLTSALIPSLGQVMDAEKPARVIVQGDTATAMAASLAAYYRKIPVDHVEAGLRSGNIYHPWPEEVNRKIVAAIASLHFAPTSTAAEALARENIARDRIHVTGNTVIDALQWAARRIAQQPLLASGLADLEKRFAGKRIIAVTSHRRENFGAGLENIARALRRIAARRDVALIFPVHPNPQVRRVMDGALLDLDNVAMIEPLDYPHFVRLMSIADIMLTDSGGVQEEAPALGKPVLVMRETTERPEGIAAGTARLVGTDENRIVSEIFKLLDDTSAYEAMAHSHNPFGDGQASRRIVDLLAGEIWPS